MWEAPDNKCLLYKEGQVWSGDVKTMRGEEDWGEEKVERMVMKTEGEGSLLSPCNPAG